MNELLAALATVYVTYLIIDSGFPPIAWVRGKVLDSAGDALAYLLTCWWCMGFWVSLTVVCGSLILGVDFHAPVLLVFVGALASGLIGEVVNVLHMTHANLVKGLNRE